MRAAKKLLRDERRGLQNEPRFTHSEGNRLVKIRKFVCYIGRVNMCFYILQDKKIYFKYSYIYLVSLLLLPLFLLSLFFSKKCLWHRESNWNWPKITIQYRLLEIFFRRNSAVNRREFMIEMKIVNHEAAGTCSSYVISDYQRARVHWSSADVYFSIGRARTKSQSRLANWHDSLLCTRAEHAGRICLRVIASRNRVPYFSRSLSSSSSSLWCTIDGSDRPCSPRGGSLAGRNALLSLLADARRLVFQGKNKAHDRRRIFFPLTFHRCRILGRGAGGGKFIAVPFTGSPTLKTVLIVVVASSGDC